MNLVYKRPKTLNNDRTHYCPGCGHGILLRILGEVIDDLNIRDKTIMINPVGCAVFLYKYLECDHIQAAHGRAPAVATAVKRLLPNSIVIS